MESKTSLKEYSLAAKGGNYNYNNKRIQEDGYSDWQNLEC